MAGPCNRLALGVALVFALVATRVGAVNPEDKFEGVLDLTPETFKTTVTGAKAALVEFYAPWCGHCKKFAPELKELGALVAADPDLAGRVVIAKLDADQHKSLNARLDVTAYPTVKFFPRGHEVNRKNSRTFNGAHTADALVRYLKRKLAADKAFARVAALDALAAKMGVADGAGALKKLAAEVEAAAAKLAGGGDAQYAAVYAKLAAKAAGKGDAGWFKLEKARVERLLAGGSMSAAKAAELSARASVLGGFLGEPADAAGASSGGDGDGGRGDFDEDEEEDDDEDDLNGGVDPADDLDNEDDYIDAPHAFDNVQFL